MSKVAKGRIRRSNIQTLAGQAAPSRPPCAKRLPSPPIERSGWRWRPARVGWEKAAGGCNGLDGRIGFDGRRRGGRLTVILRPASRTLLERHPSLKPLWLSSRLQGRPARLHSYRNTTTGSTLMARRAGTAQAISAMPPSNAITPANTNGSKGRVP